MNKKKRIPQTLWIRIKEWWNRDNGCVFLIRGILVVTSLVLFFSLILGLVAFSIVSLTTPSFDERLIMYHQRYGNCIESDISISACELAALDYAGLTNGP